MVTISHIELKRFKRIEKAFSMIMDGIKKHEIVEMTGLSEDKANEIYDAYLEVQQQ